MTDVSTQAVSVGPDLPGYTVLTVPGWQGSGAQHWQTLWELQHGDQRIEQHDWMRPLRGDWMLRIEENVVNASRPVLLAAHSLGCLAVSWWARHTRHAARVQGALLVAPPDIEGGVLAPRFAQWKPVMRVPLPFPSMVVASQNDPYCDIEAAQRLAQDWGSAWRDAGAGGHLNADSGLGAWPEARAWLRALAQAPQAKE